MSTVQSMMELAGTAPPSNSATNNSRWKPTILIAGGTSACQVAALLKARVGENAAFQVLAIDTNPNTALEVCGEGRLSESEFTVITLDPPGTLADTAERTEGWRAHAPAIRVCTGDDKDSGAGRQQVLSAFAAAVKGPALTTTIQNMLLAAAEMSDGQVIDVFVAKHAKGGTGLGMAMQLAWCIAEAARRARLSVRIIGLTLIEHTPDSTAHDTAAPAQFGYLASVACAAAEVPDVVSVPCINGADRSNRESMPKLFDEEILLDRNQANKLISREGLIALAVDTVVSRAGPGRALEGDFRNKRAQGDHQFSSDLGPRIFTTRAAATLLFEPPKQRVISRAAPLLLERLMDPASTLDAKVRTARVGALAKMLMVNNPDLRPIKTEAKVADKAAGLSADAGVKASIATRVLAELPREMEQLKQAAANEVDLKLADRVAQTKDHLRKRVVPASITELGLRITVEELDRAARALIKCDSDPTPSGGVASDRPADVAARRKAMLGEATKAVVAADTRFGRATGSYGRAAAKVVQSSAAVALSDIAAHAEAVAATFPTRLSEVLTDLGDELRDAMRVATESVQRVAELDHKPEEGIGFVETVPDQEYIIRATGQVFAHEAMKTAVQAAAVRLGHGDSVDLSRMAASIISSSGVILPKSLSEYLTSNPRETRRLMEGLVRKVADGYTSLFDQNASVGRSPAGVLAVERHVDAAQIIDPTLMSFANFQSKQPVLGDDPDRVVVSYETRFWAFGEFRLGDARAAWEVLTPMRRMIHAPFIRPGASLPQWGVVDAETRRIRLRELVFDLLARGQAQRSGEVLRLMPVIAARVGAPGAGLLGRGVAQSVDTLDSDSRLAGLLRSQVRKYDDLAGDDRLLEQLEGSMLTAETLVARCSLDGPDGFRCHIQGQIDTLRARGARGEMDDDSAQA